jgi:hypothetical protein
MPLAWASSAQALDIPIIVDSAIPIAEAFVDAVNVMTFLRFAALPPAIRLSVRQILFESILALFALHSALHGSVHFPNYS